MRLLLPFFLLATPALAAETVRLPDAERDQIIAQAAAGPERDPVLTAQQGFDAGSAQGSSVLTRSLYPEFNGEGPPAPDRKPHGEMSMFVGNGGAAGIADLPRRAQPLTFASSSLRKPGSSRPPPDAAGFGT